MNISEEPRQGSATKSIGIEDLASLANLSVDTIRFYQTRGLLDPPSRSGRQALYDSSHVRRLEEIRELQRTGLSLNTIRRIFSKDVEEADMALFNALARPFDATPDLEYLTLDELSGRTSIPKPLLSALVNEGLITPIKVDGLEKFPSSDIKMAKGGLAMLESGIPLSDLLGLAKRHHAAMKESALLAIDLFDQYIREPIVNSPDTERSSEALISAFKELLPAAVALVAGHFERTLLSLAQNHLETVGAKPEIDAVHRAIQEPSSLSRKREI